MKNFSFLTLLSFLLLAVNPLIAQDTTPPVITCPGDIIENNAAGTCGAVVTYDYPTATDDSDAAGPPMTDTFTYTGSIQNWTVPSGVYEITIEAFGAQGGGPTSGVNISTDPGLGARMRGDFNVTPGEVINILVGQQGPSSANGSSSGGGGSFVVDTSNNPLIIAGGGGGSWIDDFSVRGSNGGHGLITEAGGSNGVSNGGMNGNGGAAVYAGGGGGFFTDGADGSLGLGGDAYLNGGAGGSGGTGGQAGGYGGGGSHTNNGCCRAGGGGGYSGGAGGGRAGGDEPSGGGGSLNVGTNQSNSSGVRNGNGLVTITYSVITSSTTITQTSGMASGSTFPVGTTTNTFVATDPSGNMSSCSFNVTINDNEDPVISCPININELADPGACSKVVSYSTPIGTDNCPGATTTQTNGLPSGSSFPVGTTTNTFVVTDSNGRSAMCSFDITITENENPMISCPSNIIQGNDPGVCEAMVTWTAPMGTDNCSGVMTSSTHSPGDIFPVGTTTVTYTATDSSGNTASCSFDVTVNDTESPNIACESPIIVSSDAGTCGAVVTFNAPTVSDNCDMTSPPITETFNYTGSLQNWTVPAGITSVTIEVFGAEGGGPTSDPFITTTPGLGARMRGDFNVTPGEVINILVGQKGPSNANGSSSGGGGSFVADSSNNPLIIAGGGGGSWVQGFSPARGSDGGHGLTTEAGGSNSISTGGTNGNGANSVLAGGGGGFYTDGSNGAYGLGGDAYLNGGAGGGAGTSGGDPGGYGGGGSHTNNGCCFAGGGGGYSGGVGGGRSSGDEPSGGGGSYNNGSNQSNSSGVRNGNGLVTITYLMYISNTTVTQTGGLPSGSTFPVGTTTNTFVATDSSGNSSMCSFDVTVNDTEDPVITCPADITQDNDPGDCGAIVTFAATATDNCSAVVTYSQNPDTFFPVGTTTVTATATDPSGNSVSCDFDITVNDIEDPAITCPADITQDNDPGDCGAIVTFAATATDNCSAVVTYSQNPDTFFPVGTTTVTATATDPSGNSVSCDFEITVNDIEDPVITCPADITQDNDPGDCGAIVTFAATATDNCSAVVTYSQNPGTYFPVGTTTVTATATDPSGNSASCDFDITVNDTEDPDIVCMDITVALDTAGNATVLPGDVDGGSSDNCGIVTSSVFPNTFTCDDIGDNAVTFKVTDASGNSAICGVTVTIIDDMLPTIACPSDVIMTADPGACGTNVTFADALALDNCDVTVSQTDGGASGSFFPVGVTTIEFTATDAGGNMTTCSFTITITDDEDPVAVCQDITVQLDATGSVTITPGDIDDGSSDNCGIDSSSLDIDTFDCSNVGANTVTLTITDDSGNISTCTATVTVEDVEAPTIVCQDITVELDANGMVTVNANDLVDTSADNCGPITITSDIDNFNCDDLGVNEVTITATDASGNTASCIAMVTVEDNLAPVLVCQSATITITEDGTATVDPLLLLDMTNPLDNCAIDALATDAGVLDCSDVGTTITVTVFATDTSGNISSCTTTIDVVDMVGPVYDQGTLPGDQVRDPGPDGIYILEDFTQGVTAQDNCSESAQAIVIDQNPAPGTPLGVGVYDITLSAVDDLGNMTDYVFELIINPIMGIEENTLVGLVLYPNPAQDVVVLSNPQGANINSLSIYDLTGRLISTHNMINMGAEKTIDVSQLQSATYMVVIQGEGGLVTKQLIKE